ncbi:MULTISPECIES: IS110 family transposase [Bacillaceae]|uniref:IS110 family transposase n=1 Tax=Bacillaceae TaxID=186817 RepID=UPI000BFC0143|nr:MULTISPECIES: IS110 family transposase [Bacillaceae]PGT77930.1 IS110 family transposase [Bacillus sp. AFS040349]UGB31966.1 IS110 family transposase [Metabacillus sp. B2-18]
MGLKNKNYINNIQGRKGSQFSSQLRGLNLEKVLIVAIDAAKYFQKALICNYFGDVIEKPFFFGINEVGIKDICSRIKRAEKELQAEKLLIGVEVTGHYYEDIVKELSKFGYHVTLINAATTHEERASALNWSKTDDLDLYAIAHALMQNKGMENKLPEGNFRKLMTLTRARRTEVQKRSKTRVKIRTLMDHIWREFQGYIEVKGNVPRKKLIFSDFWGKSSLIFMEHYPHPSDVLSLGLNGIREISRLQKLRMREDTMNTLLSVAENSIVKPKEDLSAELLLLQLALRDLRQLNETIIILEKEIERVLLQTEGRLLLTVPGIGVITAAEFFSELGEVSHYENAGQLIKKAGTNPIIIQSGGTQGFYGKISKQGNKHLRFIVYTVGKSLAQHNKDLRPFFDRLRERGKHARKAYIALGNKFIKIAFSMLQHKKPYQSKQPQYSYLSEIKKKLNYTKTEEFLKIVLAA